MSTSSNSRVAVARQQNSLLTNMTSDIADHEWDEPTTESVPTSPYVESEIVFLDVGSLATRFLVHSLMLRKSAPLFALASKEQPVSLPKLDEGPAHTLVHHLYAGTFETKFRMTPVGKFRHSTCVYCAAVQYHLPGLAELSKDKIVEAGEGLPIFDILRVARDQAFPLLPETDVWYSEYLEDVIQKAMAQNPEPFRRPDFTTHVEGNSRLLQIVWKTVMSSYTITSALASTKENGAETPLAESMITESEAPTQSSQHQLPSPTESVLDSPPTSGAADDLIEPQHLDLDASATAKAKHQTHEKFAKSESEGNVDVTFSDDFGLPAIDPTTSQPHIEVVRIVDKAVPDVKKPQHVRTDSVVEEDHAVPEKAFEEAKSVAVPMLSNVNSDAAKKSKKKNKKKGSTVF